MEDRAARLDPLFFASQFGRLLCFSFHLSRRSGRVEYDAPACVCAAQEEREAAVRRVPGARELPAPGGDGVEGAERFDLKLAERQRAHLLARVVVRLVARE